MEYAQRPLPLIQTRIEWQLSSSCPLPPIAARLDRNELLQMLEVEEKPESGPDPPQGAPVQHPNTTTGPSDTGPSEGVPSPGDQYHQTEQTPGPSSNGYSKPPGQPNRPGSGGYNLEKHLINSCGWTKSEFREVQAMVQDLAKRKLDLSTSYQSQRIHTRGDVVRDVKDVHPVSRGYDDDWPIKDMLRVFLKNSSEQHRRRTGKVKSKHRGTSPGTDE
ncbi:hypothetical protein GGX14DRAFT_574131 [Mycena pura]|uniref:Uncharacterized protein n=1 Tax=Mycena pura TaxID=153505 RepID=A0AAD6Y3P5_9AGAR|nr:hypothetical protein GGX14DRAFT_574131 [Mycena pura]